MRDQVTIDLTTDIDPAHLDRVFGDADRRLEAMEAKLRQSARAVRCKQRNASRRCKEATVLGRTHDAQHARLHAARYAHLADELDQAAEDLRVEVEASCCHEPLPLRDLVLPTLDEVEELP